MLLLLATLSLTQCPDARVEPRAAARIDADHFWVAGTSRCGMCSSRGYLALADFGRGEAKGLVLPPGDEAEELEHVAASARVIAAAGQRSCEVGFEPFAVVSFDEGATFTRHRLDVGPVYSARASAVWIRGATAVVRVEVAATSNDDEAPMCFELSKKAKVRRVWWCPVPLPSALPVRVAENRLVAPSGRTATLIP